MSKVLIVICFAVCGVSFVKSHWWPAKLQADHISYSPELLQDLHDFIDLIPQIVVDELIAEHMAFDSEFRKAIKYLRSSDFKKLQQQAESLPEIIAIINYVHLNDTVIRSRVLLDERLRHQLLSNAYKNLVYHSRIANENEEVEVKLLLLPQKVRYSARPLAGLNTFVSFTRDLVSKLPRDRFVALINKKRKSGKVFPKFYEALRSKGFQPLLEKTMKSQNVQNLIKTLASHEIDAVGLKGIALEVISWGPTI